MKPTIITSSIGVLSEVKCKKAGSSGLVHSKYQIMLSLLKAVRNCFLQCKDEIKVRISTYT